MTTKHGTGICEDCNGQCFRNSKKCRSCYDASRVKPMPLCVECGSKRDRHSRRLCGPCHKSALQARGYDSNAYARKRTSWTQSVWYGQRDLLQRVDGRRKGAAFEVTAATKIFPLIGAVDAVHLANLCQQAPFDFIATLCGERIAIDVTVKWQKAIGTKRKLAAALGLPLYFLMICPRKPRFYWFGLVEAGKKSMRVPASLVREIEVAR